ncbi:hypothetical protein RRG08_052013 [Elysia crispata]|uniref:Uncharacterized protein n=1 Tax=Elysia crispata TaxID=231223 RepID=A0AAE0ZCV9_9GAST|nr:hypothetical protein RRG08_052013 [Elysia crispata]
MGNNSKNKNSVKTLQQRAIRQGTVTGAVVSSFTARGALWNRYESVDPMALYPLHDQRDESFVYYFSEVDKQEAEILDRLRDSHKPGVAF